MNIWKANDGPTKAKAEWFWIVKTAKSIKLSQTLELTISKQKYTSPVIKAHKIL